MPLGPLGVRPYRFEKMGLIRLRAESGYYIRDPGHYTEDCRILGSFWRELRGTQNMQNIQIHTCLFSIGFTFNLVYVKIPHIFLADELLVNVVYVFRCNDLMGNSLKRTSRHCAARRRMPPHSAANAPRTAALHRSTEFC